MLKNYIKIAVRNLWKQKLFSFINIFGLALSMSVCLMVLMQLKEQLAYDNFHPNADRIYRTITEFSNKDGDRYRFASSPLPLASSLSSDYPFIESIARLQPTGSKKITANKKELTINGAFTDAAFLTVFGFHLQEGNTVSALTEPNTIVLTKESATRFFGNENAMGKTIVIEGWGGFKVTGILAEPKGKSHIDFNSYISSSSVPLLEKNRAISPALEAWNKADAGYTYVLLRNTASKKQLTSALTQIASNLMRQSKTNGKEGIAFEAQPFNKIILGEELMNGIGNTGSIGKVASGLIVAFIILLSACFNYTNLSIARSLKRGKEVGVRKVSGASRSQIFYQFIVESVFVAFLSLGVAYLFLQLIIDYSPFGHEFIAPDAKVDANLLGWFALFSLFTGVLAGALPAWALSSFKPVQVLKNLMTIRLFGGNNFRKSLTVVQFSLSLLIIIFTLTFSKQFNYMASANPGFERENLLNIQLQGNDYRLFYNELVKLNGVEKVSASSLSLGRGASGNVAVKSNIANQPINIDYFDTDSNFVQNMGLRLLAGNCFGNNFSNQEEYAVINENAVKLLGYKNASQTIGQPLWLNDTTQVHITGVINDFYYRGMESPIQPVILRNRPENFGLVTVRSTTNNRPALQASIERIWKQLYPGQAFEYSWLKEQLQGQQGAWSTVSLLGFLAIIAITIACLGLLGMVTYTTETRKKEIGIRKVMGADISAIIYLLSKGFVRLVVIAGLIAVPLASIAGYLFLNVFANRISLGFGIPVLSFISLLLVVLTTISSQIYKTAAANPVKSLATE